jgi:hypothetical protein
VEQAHLWKLRRIGLPVITHSRPHAQGAPGNRVPEIVVGIDENACGKGNPDIFFQPRPRGGGGDGREFHVFLRAHQVSAF